MCACNSNAIIGLVIVPHVNMCIHINLLSKTWSIKSNCGFMPVCNILGAFRIAYENKKNPLKSNLTLLKNYAI